MLTKDKVAERKQVWAERWSIAREAAKCETAEDLEALAERTGVAVNSLRNYAGVARAYPAKDVRKYVTKVPFTLAEVVRGADDRLDLLEQAANGELDVAGARRLMAERKAAKAGEQDA